MDGLVVAYGAIVVLAILGFLAVVLLLGDSWVRRPPKRWQQPPEEQWAEQCERCGRYVSDFHAVTAVLDPAGLIDGASMPGEATGMAAFFCAEHCPGGCQREQEAS